MTAPNLIKPDILTALDRRLGDDRRCYVKAKQLAQDIDHSPREIGKAFEALSQHESVDGVAIEKWSRSACSGAGYTWEVTRVGDDG